MSVLSLDPTAPGLLPGASPSVRYPGVRAAVDGNTAVFLCEREASDGAGAYPITPSTQMGEYWAAAAAAGHLNISGRPLIFIEPEGEHAAAAVTAGLSMTGLRAANFSSGQGIAYMHESLYAAVGKRLTYVLNVGARAMTKSTLNVHAGHDDYHCIDDTGFFQLFAKNVQAAADLNLIAHRIAELALNPGLVAQDGFLTTHLIESMLLPERDLILEFLGRPDDEIETPTPAQRLLYGAHRRRIPVLWDVDDPAQTGLVQNQDAYMQSVAAQRPFFFDHLVELTERAFDEFAALTGRRYGRVGDYRVDDAEYLIVGQGSVVSSAEAVADYLRTTRGLRVGVVDLTMFRPFPADRLGDLLRGRKGVVVLERTDQPLAVDLPLVREIRATVAKCLENGRDPARPVHPDLAVYRELADAPAIYSGCFGLGSRDLQPEGIVGAIENMLPGGAGRKQFYLSIDFLHDKPVGAKQESYQQAIEAGYPEVRALAVHGSENPNLMPAGSLAVRFHSIGGWGAITTGKNLAMTLFDLLGYHVKANPKYGSEKKGQPTTYYLAVAPEPIRVNCETIFVDVVLSPDPNVFQHTNALAGLKDGGVFILQSDRAASEEVWQAIPAAFQKTILERRIRVFALDAFKIAREEATDPELQLRMQGIAFQGAFFAAAPILAQAGLDESRLLSAIRDQLQEKFGAKGARVVEDNLRVVRRGYDELVRVEPGPISRPERPERAIAAEPSLPVMAQRLPKSAHPISDVHRFWEQTGSFYARGMGSDNLTDPFIGLGVMPASTSLFRDMTAIRFQHPEWVPENCTSCAKCWTVCPDTAIPGLVSEVGAVLETVVRRARKSGATLELLPKSLRELERHLRGAFERAVDSAPVAELVGEAAGRVLAESPLAGEEREALGREIELFRAALGDFQLKLTRPFYRQPEKERPGSGGLLSITIDPYTCKGCLECVEVCESDALRPVAQTEASIRRLRADWDLWLDLPTTPKRFQRIKDLEAGSGALQMLLLDKASYLAFASGDGACLGCAEKTAVHLFTATVEALMQPRVARHVERLDGLIARLREREAEGGAAGAASRTRAAALRTRLEQLRGRYLDGPSGRSRSRMGIVNSTGCSSVWGSTWPYNPYPFPWANHLFQDSPSMAMGIFEGHMARMADGFRLIRQAETELAGGDPELHDAELVYFDWRQFSDEEWELCPPVVAVGGDGAMYDIGFQNLSRMMMSGKPIKVLVLDTQVYSNTGGQACTSGFLGQVSDMAQFGKVWQGKPEPRKEIGLIAMAHRTTYVMQSTIAHPKHMIEGFIRGLKARRPALFNLYSSCQPEHGIGDDMSAHQARLAVESRAYPLFRYDPDRGRTPGECFDLDGNPSPDSSWPAYTLRYLEGGREKTMKVPMTFADFAITEGRFRKHYRTAPPETWHDGMVPLAEFLDLSPAEREEKFPFIWSVDREQRLSRLLVDRTMVESCEDRRDFWTTLRSLAAAGAVPAARAAAKEVAS